MAELYVRKNPISFRSGSRSTNCRKRRRANFAYLFFVTSEIWPRNSRKQPTASCDTSRPHARSIHPTVSSFQAIPIASSCFRFQPPAPDCPLDDFPRQYCHLALNEPSVLALFLFFGK